MGRLARRGAGGERREEDLEGSAGDDVVVGVAEGHGVGDLEGAVDEQDHDEDIPTLLHAIVGVDGDVLAEQLGLLLWTLQVVSLVQNIVDKYGELLEIVDGVSVLGTGGSSRLLTYHVLDQPIEFQEAGIINAESCLHDIY